MKEIGVGSENLRNRKILEGKGKGANEKTQDEKK